VQHYLEASSTLEPVHPHRSVLFTCRVVVPLSYRHSRGGSIKCRIWFDLSPANSTILLHLARGSSVLLGIPICTDCSWWDKVKKKEKNCSVCLLVWSFFWPHFCRHSKKTFPLFSRVLVIIMSSFLISLCHILML
jgi:hypothetical protein